MIEPALGMRWPPIRSNSVDLPAPLGPKIARLSPASTASATSRTAVTSPNRLVMPESSRIGMAIPSQAHGQPPCYAHNAVRTDPDHDDEQQAQNHVPVIGIGTRPVLKQQNDRGTNNRPDDCAGATNENHDQRSGRLRPACRVGRDEMREADIDAAGESTEAGRDQEGDELVAPDVVTERPQALGIVANADQDRPERRPVKSPQQKETHRAANKDEAIDRLACLQNRRIEQSGRRNDEPVRASR